MKFRRAVLRREREARGWTRTELGRRATLHPAAVGKIESGREKPYPIQVEKLASALGITPDVLVADWPRPSA